MKNITLIFCLLTFVYSNAQFPEGFETSVPPTGWASYIGVNGLGNSQDWRATTVSNSGAQAAYVRYENVSGGIAEDWLVTPQLTPDASTNLLSFMQRQSYVTDYGSVYTVRISTLSQTNHSDFITIDTQTELDFTYYYTLKEIDLSAYNGIPIYIAFVMEQDDGDDWYIDDVSLSAIPSCNESTLLSVSSLTTSSAIISWMPSGEQTNYNLRLYEGEDTSTTPIIEHLNLPGTLLDSGSYLTGLVDNSTYYFTIESVCGNNTSGAVGIGFSTLALPISPENYVQDFSSFPGLLWKEAIGSLASGPEGLTSSWEPDIFTNQGNDLSAKINLYFANTNHWLISPDFNLGTNSHILTMDVAVTQWNLTTSSAMGVDDSVKVLISEDYGESWTVLYTWNALNTPTNIRTTIPSIDLTPYTGVVRFAILASDGPINDIEDYDFFIDNFTISSSTLTTAEADLNINFNYYPNPVINNLFISTKDEIQDIKLYDILGNKILDFNPKNNKVELNFMSYKSGVYILNVETQYAQKSIKIVKK